MHNKRRLRVGIDDAPPLPMQIGTPESGDLQGYEVDLLNLLAARLACEIEYRHAPWSVIIHELVAGALDLICSAATVTEERKLQVDFCRPHLELKLALVERQGTATPLNLQSARLGVRRGTTAEAFVLNQVGGREPALRSESNEELYAALAEGRIDGVIDDSPIAMHFATHTPTLHYAHSYPGTEGEYAVVVSKDTPGLREEINSSLEAMESDGTLSALRERWFGTRAPLVG